MSSRKKRHGLKVRAVETAREQIDVPNVVRLDHGHRGRRARV